MTIRDVKPKDAASICDIYNEHVRNTVVTFEFDVVGEVEMRERISSITQTYPWIVLEKDGALCGYAYATEWRHRVAYQQTVETAIYVSEDAQGCGYGRELYLALIERLRLSSRGFHVALGAIALPNPASIALHEKLGFKKVAEFPEVGRKFERWINVGFWQLDL
ncbi:MAG: L-amino acid N-acyltransferase YncA [Planctomycetota bacterium]|jgi:L-amino acid N-acyltransferase YncA